VPDTPKAFRARWAIAADLVEPGRDSQGEGVNIGMISDPPGMMQCLFIFSGETEEMRFDAVEREGHRVQSAQADGGVAATQGLGPARSGKA